MVKKKKTFKIKVKNSLIKVKAYSKKQAIFIGFVKNFGKLKSIAKKKSEYRKLKRDN